MGESGAKAVMSGSDAKRLLELERTAPMKPGEKWNILDNNWWVEFAEKTDYAKDSDPIEMRPVDNSVMVEQAKDGGGGFVLKANLELKVHIIVLPGAVFNQLVQTFGIGCPERDVIEREVIITGSTWEQGSSFIEVYPLKIMVTDIRLDSGPDFVPVTISRACTTDQIRDAMLDELGITEPGDRRDAKFYVEGSKGMREELPGLSDKNPAGRSKLIALLSSGLPVYADVPTSDLAVFDAPQKEQAQDQNVWGEIQQETTGNGPSTRAGTRYASGGLPHEPSQFQRGLCGLHNLGNTCFMNSALQCMSNVPELTGYFLRDEYANEINEQNPLGTHGKLVKEYAEMLKELWSGQQGAVRPFKLKSVIGEFAPRFNGYAQQDSQEFTAFLLDGLHEDLNRIKKKPYLEEKEGDGLGEQQAAEEAWIDYKKRNDSVIVDLLHGQLKSTLTCNVCNKISVKFDPFCFLSVPIPAKERSVKSTITFVRKEQKWAKFTITHSNKTTAHQVKQVLRDSLQLSPNTQIVLLTQYNGDLVDDDSTLLPATPYPSYYTKSFYAYAVEPGPIMLVENRVNGLQYTCPVFPVFPVNRPERITRRAIHAEVLPRLRALLCRTAAAAPQPVPDAASSSSSSSTTTHSCNKAVEQDHANGNADEQQPMEHDADDERSSSSGNEGEDASEKDTDPAEPVELLLAQAHLQCTNTFPEAEDEEPHYEPDGPVVKLILKWDEQHRKLFNIVDVANLVDREVNMQTTMKKIYSLKECIDLYTLREQLKEEDSWYCPRCKVHQQAFKKLELWSLPKIFIIHLKRFIYSRYTRDKIDTEIEIPVKGLNLSDKILNPAHKQELYDLIGISNHMGGLGSGHYTAYALNGDQWCEFNDSHASALGKHIPEMFNSREAYMLVYRRRDCK